MSNEEFWYWYHQGEIIITSVSSEHLGNGNIDINIEGKWRQPMECLTMEIKLDEF